MIAKKMKGRSRPVFLILAGVAVMGLIIISFPSRQEEGSEITVPLKTKEEAIMKTTYFDTEIDMLQSVLKLRAVKNTTCKNDCNSEKGWGKCNQEENRCRCSPGHGDTDCSLHREVLYADHDLYAGTTLRNVDVSGWDKGGKLYAGLVEATKPNLVIEVGVWKGSSASKLSAALKEQGGGLFIGVDTWLPVKNFWENQKAHNRMKDLHFVNGWPTIFYTFLGNIKQLGLQEYAIPFPATSRTASDFLFDRGTQAELIHVDAAHEYVDVQEDLALWWRILRPGGVMLGDDWSEAWPGVKKAVSEHARAEGLEIFQYKNKWWVSKPL